MTENLNRWHNAVQIMCNCEGGCGAYRLCAKIKSMGKTIRVCRDCFPDGWWREELKKR